MAKLTSPGSTRAPPVSRGAQHADDRAGSVEHRPAGVAGLGGEGEPVGTAVAVEAAHIGEAAEGERRRAERAAEGIARDRDFGLEPRCVRRQAGHRQWAPKLGAGGQERETRRRVLGGDVCVGVFAEGDAFHRRRWLRSSSPPRRRRRRKKPRTRPFGAADFEAGREGRCSWLSPQRSRPGKNAFDGAEALLEGADRTRPRRCMSPAGQTRVKARLDRRAVGQRECVRGDLAVRPGQHEGDSA